MRCYFWCTADYWRLWTNLWSMESPNGIVGYFCGTPHYVCGFEKHGFWGWKFYSI